MEAHVLVLSAVLAAAAAPALVELTLLSIAGLLPSRPQGAQSHLISRLAVVVPAHNEEAGVAACVQSLRSAQQTNAELEIVVVADNCTDRTAEAASKAGARVLVRQAPNQRGKGFALDFAFRRLRNEGFEGFIVIDADSRVSPNFLREGEDAFSRGCAAFQTRYQVANPEASLRAGWLHLAWMAFNVLRPRGRDRLGWSAGLLGNGFGLTAKVLRESPYTAASIVEDLEYHLQLVSTGVKVRFLDRATVYAEAPGDSRAAAAQRARWEGGRWRFVGEAVPLLWKRVIGGQLRALAPLLDLLTPPLALAAPAFALLAATPFAPFGYAGLLVLAFHLTSAMLVGGAGWADLKALLFAPLYVAWKITQIPRLLRTARPDAAWTRTARTKA